ncbi:MAG: SCO family protein [Minicystis sp.]
MEPTGKRYLRAVEVLAVVLALGGATGCGRSPRARDDKAPAMEEEEARIAPATDVTVPDEELVDQDGHPVRLRELFADHVVAVNFVFTTCASICSAMTAIFGRVQRDLGAAMESKVRLVSISIDPATDTPEKLRAYASRFDRGAGWTFLTGAPERVEAVLRALGGLAPVKERHRPITLIGNMAQGRWQRIHGIAPPRRLASWIRPMVHE